MSIFWQNSDSKNLSNYFRTVVHWQMRYCALIMLCKHTITPHCNQHSNLIMRFLQPICKQKLLYPNSGQVLEFPSTNPQNQFLFCTHMVSRNRNRKSRKQETKNRKGLEKKPFVWLLFFFFFWTDLQIPWKWKWFLFVRFQLRN